MAKVLLTEAAKEQDKVFKRMDKFDSVVTEYLRSNRKTVDYLCEKIEVDPSTLWRYRRQGRRGIGGITNESPNCQKA